MTAPVIRPGWLTRPQTEKLFAVLGADNLRAVGGCVRDSLHRPDGSGAQSEAGVDVDMATTHEPDIVTELLQAAGVKVVPTGVKYGTVTAIVDGLPYEITTLRQDVETDGRHAKVIYGTDWTADARRRDFTVNALYCDASGGIHDPLGCGVEDLQAGKVVFIGDASTRIREDYLRVLRFFRFHALIGAAVPDGAAVAACREAARDATGLSALSGERLQQELLKILAIADPVPALCAMHEAGVLAFAVPVGAMKTGLERLARLVAFDQYVGPVDPVLRLAGLVAHAAQDIAALAGHLRLSNNDRDRLTTWLSGPFHEAPVTPDNRVKLAYHLGPEVSAQLVLLRLSESGQTPDLNGLKSDIRELRTLALPVFPITGKMLLEAGLTPGPEMGRMLADLEAWWLDGGMQADEASLLARLHEMMDASGTD